MAGSITIENLIPLIEQGKTVLIDVRSPSEYREFSMPNSINIPLFNDEERAEVGTLYTQVSVEAAKERGLEIVAAKLPDFIRAFQGIEGDKTVFCWRGGMRSKTAATLVDLMGIRVQRLEGGVRTYRKWVVAQLQEIKQPSKAYILNGLTGTGKTTVLKALQEEGYPVIDLEGMAGHKGSIFGHIGEQPQNQKAFDSLLLHRLRQLKNAPYVLFEAESNRIGKVVMPPFLSELKDRSKQLVIELPMEERIHEILKGYQPEKHQQACMEAFRRIKMHIHTPVAKQIETDLEEGRFDTAIRALLEHYYDSRYEYTSIQYPHVQKAFLKVQSVQEATHAVKAWLTEQERETADTK